MILNGVLTGLSWQQELVVIKCIDDFVQPTEQTQSAYTLKSADYIKSLFNNYSLAYAKTSGRILSGTARSLLGPMESSPSGATLQMSPFSTGGTSQTRSIHELSSIALGASRSILNLNAVNQMTMLPVSEHANYLQQYAAPVEFCPYDETSYECDLSYPFRTFDGTCNNPNYAWWGKSESPFKRILPPLYDDGLNAPRVRSVKGSMLASLNLFLFCL